MDERLVSEQMKFVFEGHLTYAASEGRLLLALELFVPPQRPLLQVPSTAYVATEMPT